MRFLPFVLTCFSFFTTGTFTLAAEDTCTFTSGDAHFNIQPLQITSKTEYQGPNKDGAWHTQWQCLTDKNCPTPPSYEYHFNLCTALQKSPKVPAPPPATGFIPGCDGEDVKDGWNAYQYYIKNTTNADNKCFPISKAEQSSSYTLIKENYPSQGFMIKYAGGSDCTDTKTGTKIPRTFTIHIRCSANLPPEPKLDSNEGAGQFKKSANTRHFNTFATTTPASICTPDFQDFKPDCHLNIGNVYEASHCQYHVNIDTVLGCPQSCRIGDTACSNHGICAEDTSVKRTRCFCDIGYGGEHCENVLDSSTVVTRSPNTVLTVFVLILLFAALGLGYALYRKIRGFHGDFDHQYGQLAAKPDQMGNLQNA